MIFKKSVVYSLRFDRPPVKLQVFPDFRNSIFKGFSDHTIGTSAAIYASAHGAQYLEKHFTLSYGFQKNTEKAHVGAMTMEDLTQIKKISTEFEMIKR